MPLLLLLWAWLVTWLASVGLPLESGGHPAAQGDDSAPDTQGKALSAVKTRNLRAPFAT